MFKTNIVVSNYSNTDEPWYLITNDDTSRAVRNYSYRFGSIESIFKSQKSNGFRLESTNTQKIEHFISLLLLCVLLLFGLLLLGLTMLKIKIIIILKFVILESIKTGTVTRLYSLFNIGLSLFNRCYYNTVDFTLKFNFLLYDV